MFKTTKDIDNMLLAHEDYRNSCLNLIASENYASKRVRIIWAAI